MGDGDVGYEEELRVVRSPKGTHRSRSTGTPGYERDLLRDKETKGLKGPSESRSADQDDIERFYGYVEPPGSAQPAAEPRLGEALARAVFEGLAEGIREAVNDPEVQERARILVRHVWVAAKNRSAQLRKRSKAAAETGRSIGDTALKNVGEDPTDVVEGTLESLQEPVLTMSAEEYREQLRMLLAARQFVADRERLLLSVRIDNAEAISAELQRAFQAALESDPSTLDPEALALLIGFLGYDVAVDEAQEVLEKVHVEPLELNSPEPRAK